MTLKSITHRTCFMYEVQGRITQFVVEYDKNSPIFQVVCATVIRILMNGSVLLEVIILLY